MMDNEGQKFPAQKQERQPGKEYIMNPIPQAVNPQYKPANRLLGKVAVVTGGDSGIGRAVCHLFAREGASVAFTYVKGEEETDATETLKLIRGAMVIGAHEPTAITADIGYEENCKSVVEQVVKRYGQIHILVNNAAEQHVNPVEEITEQRLERTFRTNIFSHFFITRHAIKYMGEGGSIINSTSVQAYIGSPMSLDYTSTKGAIVSFTRGLALQLVHRGIRVNGVTPGPVWTPVQVATLPEEKIASLGSETAMERAAQPQEIAPCYVFLASQDSSYFTGQFLHPNGGMIVNA